MLGDRVWLFLSHFECVFLALRGAPQESICGHCWFYISYVFWISFWGALLTRFLVPRNLKESGPLFKVLAKSTFGLSRSGFKKALENCTFGEPFGICATFLHKIWTRKKTPRTQNGGRIGPSLEARWEARYSQKGPKIDVLAWWTYGTNLRSMLVPFGPMLVRTMLARFLGRVKGINIFENVFTARVVTCFEFGDRF